MFDENLDLREINFVELINKCGNCRIFLSLRFYVKSKFAIIESQNLHIFTNSDTLNFAFYEFLHFWRLKFTKPTKFRAPKVAKMAFLEILHMHMYILQNQFHVKSQLQKLEFLHWMIIFLQIFWNISWQHWNAQYQLLDKKCTKYFR